VAAESSHIPEGVDHALKVFHRGTGADPLVLDEFQRIEVHLNLGSATVVSDFCTFSIETTSQTR
jgi:hypothetical protein